MPQFLQRASGCGAMFTNSQNGHWITWAGVSVVASVTPHEEVRRALEEGRALGRGPVLG